MSREGLSIWVVYDHPTDHPDVYIARRFVNDRPTGDTIQGLTLDAVRDQLPAGLARFNRDPKDDPKIVECWF